MEGKLSNCREDDCISQLHLHLHSLALEQNGAPSAAVNNLGRRFTPVDAGGHGSQRNERKRRQECQPTLVT